MNYDRALYIQQTICEQFFFNRHNVEILAGSYENEPEPAELVYEIFNEVIAVNVIKSEDLIYVVELLSSNNDLYLTPIVDYFELEAGEIIATFSDSITEQAKKRPLEIGCSIGPLSEGWRGTLGCFVLDIDSRAEYILSNHHVLYSELGYKDSFIAQPSVYDGGGNDDAIGLYVRSLAPDKGGINDFDAAIAGPISAEFTYNIPGLNAHATELAEAIIDMKVYKIGATTGKTFGIIKSVVSAVKVQNSEGNILEYQYQLMIGGTEEDFLTPKNFSLPGDSGSVIFDYDTNKIVGLLFSGNGDVNSFANKIGPVFDKLGVSLK